MSILRWWFVPVVVLAATGIGPVAPAWASGACPTLDDGVTVVVDFQGLGGGTAVRCATGDPSSGIAALEQAGFSVDQVQNWRGVVCRIDGKPDAASGEDCHDMPPGDAYWGYFHAERGGSWNYSAAGAARYDPSVGSVEGWSFSGAGGPTPPRVPPPSPPPPSEPDPGEPEGDPEPVARDEAAPPAGPGPDPDPAPETTQPPSEAELEADPEVRSRLGGLRPDRHSVPGTSVVVTIPGPTVDPSPDDAATVTARAATDPGGGPGGAVVAAALVTLLSVGAVVASRRRRP